MTNNTPDPYGVAPVTPPAAGQGKGEVSAAGKVFQASVTAMLTAESDRRKMLEARGTTLLTSSTSVTTIIFALTVLVTGRDSVLVNRCAVYVLIGSLFAFLVAAGFGIRIQTKLHPVDLASREYLMKLTDNDRWGWTADRAVRNDVADKVRALGGADGTGGLRGANNTKARWVRTGSRFQLGGVALLAVAMSLELWTRLT